MGERMSLSDEHRRVVEAFVNAQQRMDLRDYFAAAALQGMLSNPDFTGNVEEYAHGAFLHADAMLKEREK
jgi:hypothetical protein